MGKRIGVSAAALYRPYANKGALATLAAECFRSFEHRLMRIGAATGIKRLNAITMAYLSFGNQHPARCALMFGA